MTEFEQGRWLRAEGSEEHVHADREQLVAAVLEVVREVIADALTFRGGAVIGLSGGSTPLPVYRALAHSRVPWAQLQFVLVDERFVPLDHPHSNEGQLREALAPIGSALRLIGLRGDATTPEAAAMAASRVVDDLPRPDLLLLGMGEDGHIASLFPGGRGCAQARSVDQTASVCATWPEPLPESAPHPRLTLSRAALARSRLNLLLITGQAKRETLMRALADPVLPVSDLYRDDMPPLQVHWSP
jgi:6-phosphogluconolactonase